MKYKSKKRDKVIEFLTSEHERTYTLVEISDAVAALGVGKSTVYRIVSELVGEGCVRKITDAKTRHCTYQYVGGECRGHLHLRCLRCGRLIHLDREVSDAVKGALREATDFTVEAGGVLYGECSVCRGEVAV